MKGWKRQLDLQRSTPKTSVPWDMHVLSNTYPNETIRISERGTVETGRTSIPKVQNTVPSPWSELQ